LVFGAPSSAAVPGFTADSSTSGTVLELPSEVFLLAVLSDDENFLKDIERLFQ
jgi:hypothetical protein